MLNILEARRAEKQTLQTWRHSGAIFNVQQPLGKNTAAAVH